MISAGEAPEPLIRDIAGRLTEHAGLDASSVSAEAVRRVVDRFLGEGVDAREIAGLAVASDSPVRAALLDAVCVGETYFHRHAEQLDRLCQLLRGFRPPRPLRAWSAGCATGEEAYSLAARLREVAPHGVEVFGTDIAPAHVAAARRGVYGSWSMRGCDLARNPWLRPSGDRFHVESSLRSWVRFEVHNVLDPPMLEAFDVVLCRNVLVYFSPDGIRRACARLSSAVAPGGFLVLGPVDAADAPPGLAPCTPGWDSIFQKNTASLLPAAEPMPARAQRCDPVPLPLVGSPPARPSDSIGLHLDALRRVEHGDDVAAEALLRRARPSYVPGLLERALLRGRQGKHALAQRLMQEVLSRTERLPNDEVIAGPEPLPVAFYRTTASAYLARHSVKGGR